MLNTRAGNSGHVQVNNVWPFDVYTLFSGCGKHFLTAAENKVRCLIESGLMPDRLFVQFWFVLLSISVCLQLQMYFFFITATFPLVNLDNGIAVVTNILPDNSDE